MANNIEDQYQLDVNVFPTELHGCVKTLFVDDDVVTEEDLHELIVIIKDHGVHRGFEDNIPAKGGTKEKTILAIVQLYENVREEKKKPHLKPSHTRLLEGLLTFWAAVEELEEDYGDDGEPERTTRIMRKVGRIGSLILKARATTNQARNPRIPTVPVTDVFKGDLESAVVTREKVQTHLAQMNIGFMTKSAIRHQPQTIPNEREKSAALAYIAKACDEGEMRKVTKDARDDITEESTFLATYQTVTFQSGDADEDATAAKREWRERLLTEVKASKVRPGESANTLADRIEQNFNDIVEMGGTVDDYMKKETILRAIEDDNRFVLAKNLLKAQRNMQHMTFNYVKKRLHDSGMQHQREADDAHQAQSLIDAKLRPMKEQLEVANATIKKLTTSKGGHSNAVVASMNISGEARAKLAAKLGYNAPTDAQSTDLLEAVQKLPQEKRDQIKKEVEAIPKPTAGYYEKVREIWRQSIGIPTRGMSPNPNKRPRTPGWMKHK
jgi:hypothetical protein